MQTFKFIFIVALSTGFFTSHSQDQQDVFGFQESPSTITTSEPRSQYPSEYAGNPFKTDQLPVTVEQKDQAYLIPERPTISIYNQSIQSPRWEDSLFEPRETAPANTLAINQKQWVN